MFNSITSVFVTTPSPSDPEHKKLTLITENGTIHQIRYREIDENDLSKYGDTLDEAITTLREEGTKCVCFYGKTVRIFEKTAMQRTFMDMEENLVSLECHFANFFSSLNVMNKVMNAEERDLQGLVQKAVSDTLEAERRRNKELQEKREQLGQKSKHSARVFHLITGLFATPEEMSVGTLLLTASMVKVVVGSLVLFGVKGLETVSAKFSRTPTPIRFPRGKAFLSSFVGNSCRDVRIASLRMIPVIGAQLANQYIRTGSLRNFIDSPAFGGLLSKAGITIGLIAYADIIRKQFAKNSDYWNEHCSGVRVFEDSTYMALTKPKMQDAVDRVTQQIQIQSAKFDPTFGITVRLPTPDLSQYHDATLFLANKEQGKENKTVVFYHGNATHRYDHLDQVRAYQKSGYNVLLCSYAGDPVTRGDGKSSKEVATKCSEKALRDDAAADLGFLKKLGVHNVAVHGWSLGGAQAMNFAQAVGKTQDKVDMDFLVLDHTFTTMPDAVQNVARKIKSLLGRLAYDFMKKFMADETGDPVRFGCDGLDNVKKMKELADNQHFINTKICCIGGAEDTIMGDESGLNFVHDLAREARSHFKSERVFEWMQGGRHESYPDGNVLNFLFYNKPTTENEA